MKKFVSIILTLVLVLSLSVGCGNKQSPKERFDEAVMNSLDIKTAKEDFDMTMSLTMDSADLEDPAMGMMLGMFNNINIKGNMQVDNENIIVGGDFEIDLQGMSYSSEIYMSKEKYIVKVPLLGKYLTIYDLTTDNENNEAFSEMFSDMDNMKALSKEINKEFLSTLDEDTLKAGSETSISSPGGDIKATPIELVLSDAQIKEQIKLSIKKLSENETLKDYLLDNMKLQNELLEGDSDTESLATDLDTSLSELDENLDTMFEMITFDTMKLTYYLDHDNNIVKTDFDISLSATENMEEGIENAFKITLTGTSNIWDINKPINVIFPELTEENSFTLEEMVEDSFGTM